jgi:hypothetical protein
MTSRAMSVRAWSVVALSAVLAAHGCALRAELGAWPDLNDNVLHYTLAARVVQAIDREENPLDFWVSEWTLGYPVLRTYQPLGSLVVALLYLALGRTVPLVEVFLWTRFLLVCLLPLTAYVTARLLMLGRAAALAAALISPLIATNYLYGIEYGSYLWRGSGLYAQAWAMHGLMLTLGLCFRAVRSGRRLMVAALLLALTFLAHFIYGYIAALSVVLLAFVPDSAARTRRALRVAAIGLLALALTAWVVVPLLQDVPLIGPGHWEAKWKQDSYGATEVARLLLTGALLDFGRLPVLSLLALFGALTCGWRLRRQNAETTLASEAPSSAYAFVLFGALLWLLLFCGRPTWGSALTLLGIGSDIHLHRLVGGVHVFLLFLAAIGLAWLWDRAAALRDPAARSAAILASVLLLLPALRERHDYLVKNARWAAENAAAYRREQADVEAAISRAGERGGRVYPGLAAGWGRTLRVGSVPLYALLSIHRVPAVAFLYHGMALTSDLMVRFDERNQAHYRLFNVTAVLANRDQSLPPFLTPVGEFGRFRLLAAPRTGFFELVAVPYSVRSDKGRFYDVDDPWLHSDWVAKRQHLWLDLGDGSPIALPSLPPGEPLPPVEDAGGLGRLDDEEQDGEVHRVHAVVEREGFLLFKTTYHPNWRAIVDGRRERAVMLSPGFVGIRLSPGDHRVEMRYEPGVEKAVLLALGVALFALAALAARRGLASRIEESAARAFEQALALFDRQDPARRRRWLTGIALVLLALPVAAPLLTNKLPAGHDALEYFPRLIEFHENVRHGIALPRWAPDLSHGYGQPFFLFNPPLVYYLGEFWHLLGWNVVAALNLTALTLIVASGFGMFLLASLYFGRAGGLLAATAYLYAPYFHVNLFVRHALAEFAAFAFFPLALYGFGRLAQRGTVRSLLLGAVAYAGVLYCHHAAALLFTPLVLAFLSFAAWQARSKRVLARLAGGLLLGLGLSASCWMPALAERQFVSVEGLREGYLLYANHFVYPRQLVHSPWGYGLSTPGTEDGMSFSVGWAHLLLAVLAFLFPRAGASEGGRGWQRFFASAALGLCVLMLPASAWLWDRWTLLQYVQFPWRLLGPVALCLALVIAPLGCRLSPATGWCRLGVASAIGVLVLANLGHARPERYREIDLRAWEPQEIARRGVAVTTKEEYESRWVRQRSPFQSERIRVVAGDATIEGLSRTPNLWRARVVARQETVLELSLAYFPGWRAWFSGKEATLEPEPQTGLIRLRAPAGDHRLEVRFTRTWPRLLADGLSLLSFLALVLIFYRSRQRMN